MRPWVLAASVVLSSIAPVRAQELKLPNKEGTVKFALMGDTGTASKAQNEVGAQMGAFHKKFPFSFVVMVGDNMYGTQTSRDFVTKFEQPYKDLIAGGVTFYAALGNHDEPGQKNYKAFNMGGDRFYAFRASTSKHGRDVGEGAQFFALDSTYLDKTQLDWLEKQLAGAPKDEWKIAFFHHPLYSSARKHGSSLDLRKVLEPMFVKYGVNLVLAGHDHVYERVKPQQGIHHFVSGAGGSLRRGDLRRGSPLTEVGFDTDYHFVLMEIDGADLHFQAVSRTGATIDSGVLHRGTAPASDAKP
ncbi:MAG: metallophosphoesterase [Vicinamibacteria bacterium]